MIKHNLAQGIKKEKGKKKNLLTCRWLTVYALARFNTRMLQAILLICLVVATTAQTTKEQGILQAQELLQQGNLSGARQLIAQGIVSWSPLL